MEYTLSPLREAGLHTLAHMRIYMDTATQGKRLCRSFEVLVLFCAMQHRLNLSFACKLAFKVVRGSFFASRFSGLLHYHVSDDNFVIQRDFPFFSLCNKEKRVCSAARQGCFNDFVLWL